MPEALRQVLDQAAAAGDVHDLHAAADAQERDVALERPTRQRKFEAVALGTVSTVFGCGGSP